jgi:hypothetical protein
VGTLGVRDADVVPCEQVGGDGQALEVLSVERGSRFVGPRKRFEGRGLRPSRERFPADLEIATSRHRGER